ncbi:hypothetical protein PFUM301597_55050 [Pseudomonas fluorescens]
MVPYVEKPSRALDVGEGFGTCHLLSLEHLAGTECPFELAHKFFEVVLRDSVKRHQVSVDVIEDFNRGGLGTHEVERGTSSKDFTRALFCSLIAIKNA